MASLAQRGRGKKKTKPKSSSKLSIFFYYREQGSTSHDTSTKNNEIRVLVEGVSSFLSPTFTYYPPASKTELKVKESETSTITDLIDTICLKYIHILINDIILLIDYKDMSI